MVERDALAAIKVAMVHGAHMPFSAPYANFATLQAACLASVEPAASYPLRNAMLLVGTTLVNGDCMARSESWRGRRCGLGEPNG
jgi:hypothetical protein